MARLNAKNNAQTRLVGDITSAATSFYVVDATVFPAAPFMISLDNEIMQVATVLGNLLSGITRAQEGTTAAAHVGNILVESRWTAGMYAGLALTEDVGAKTSLLTTIKTTIVAAINEVLGLLNTHKADKASLTELAHIKIDAAGSMDAGGVYTPGGFKTILITHDMSVTGTQTITGVGFVPRAVIAIGGIAPVSIGTISNGGVSYNIASNAGGVAGNWTLVDGLMKIIIAAGAEATATLTSYDSNGLTLTWTKTGTPTGTAYIQLLCFR